MPDSLSARSAACRLRLYSNWSSLDFISDTLISGRRHILAVVDDFTRECLALVVDTSLSGVRVAHELDAIIAVRAVPPLMIVSPTRMAESRLIHASIQHWLRSRVVRD